ncbi:hypothetical protein BC829DRAFT_87285 [Chytridium lagenaria]|nr:hypothetical protein BC829DRAFT_87285 [Chytridium lagenaria]
MDQPSFAKESVIHNELLFVKYQLTMVAVAFALSVFPVVLVGIHVAFLDVPILRQPGLDQAIYSTMLGQGIWEAMALLSVAEQVKWAYPKSLPSAMVTMGGAPLIAFVADRYISLPQSWHN